MELDLLAEGSEYISASRAAKKVGYSTDYIGQLCRAQKVPGKLIGRTWFVDLQSLIAHRQTRQLGKPRVARARVEREAPEIARVLGMPSSGSVMRGVTLSYESDSRPLLPQLAKIAAVHAEDASLNFSFVRGVVALTLALVIMVSAGSLMHRDHLAEFSFSQPASISLGDKIAASFEFFLDGFRNLKRIALSGITPGPVARSAPRLTPETSTFSEAAPVTQAVITQNAPSFSLESLKGELRTELQSYLESRLSNIAPVIYQSGPTFNSTILREEILLADTRPTITRQSTSDIDHQISVISEVLNGGNFTDATLSNARVSGPYGSFADFSWTSATGTSATTTNLYAANALFDNLVGSNINLTDLLFTRATGTSATTTNFYATNASTTNFFGNVASIGSLSFNGLTGINATSSTFAITGDSSGLTFYGTGNHDITAQSGTLRIGSNTIIGSIEAIDNTVDIGTPGVRFDKIYANEINATTLVGTIDGGNINAETLTLNFDNATADTEDSFIAFERGTLVPNALIRWDSANDRFTLNSDLALVSGIGNGSLLVNGSTTLQNFVFQNATGTNATTSSLYAGTGMFGGLLSFTGTNHAGLRLNNLTTAERDLLSPLLGATIYNTTVSKMQVYNGQWKNVGNPEIGAEVTSGTGGSVLFVDNSGNLAQDNTNFAWDDALDRLSVLNLVTTNSTSTAATSSSLYVSGLASTTNLRANVGVIGHLTGEMGIMGNLLLNGSSTFQNFTFQNATGTNATTTNLFVSGLASTTNLRANTGAFGIVNIGLANPTSKLNISGSDNQLKLEGDNSSSYTVFRLKSDARTWQFATGGSSTPEPYKGNWYVYNEGTGRTPLVIAGTTDDIGLGGDITSTALAGARFVIKQSGNVGVASSTPFAKFSVAGSDAGTTLIGADAISGFAGSLLDLKVASTTKFSINSAGDFFAAGSTTLQNFTFQNATGTNLFISGIASTTDLRANTALFGGNVGIGSTTPTSGKLAIKGSGTGTGRALVIANSSDADLIEVLDNGNIRMAASVGGVNIGGTATAPTGGLLVAGRTGIGATTVHSSARFQIGQEGTGADGMLIGGANSFGVAYNTLGTDYAFVYSPAGNAIGIGFKASLGVPTAPVITVSKTLGLGVGTTSPFARLSVAGTDSGTTLIGADAISGFGGNLLDLKVASSSKFIVNSSGNVGIGTTNPGTNLDIVGSGSDTYQLTLRSGTAYNTAAFGGILLKTNEALNSDLQASILLRGSATAGDRRLSIYAYDAVGAAFRNVTLAESGGNVGIGTTAPTSKLGVAGGLQVSAAGAPTTGAGVEISGGSSNPYIQAYNRDTSAYLPLNIYGSTLTFNPSVSGSFHVTNAGSTGIGTTTPAKNLEIFGASTPGLRITSSGTQPKLQLFSTYNNSSERNWEISTSMLAMGDFLINQGTAQNADPDTNYNTRFYINPSGNVGIGTTDPGTSRLKIVSAGSHDVPAIDIRQNTATAYGYSFSIDSVADSSLYLKGIENNVPFTILQAWNYANSGHAAGDISIPGKVGIGTTLPNAILDIQRSSLSGAATSYPSITAENMSSSQGNGSSTFNVARLMAGAGNGSVLADILTVYDTDFSGAYIGTETAHDVRLQTGGSTKMTIESGGDVGIGTTNPGYRLDVWGANTEAAVIRGNTTGAGNIGYIGFRDSGGTRIGYIGDATGANSSLYIDTDSAANNVNIQSGGGIVNLSNGRFLLDGSSRTYATDVYSDTTGSAANVFVGSDGRLMRSTSLLRFKTDLESLDSNHVHDVLTALAPGGSAAGFTYRGIGTGDDQTTRFIGWGAELVDPIEPLLVSRDKQGNPNGIMYERMVVYLTAGWAEHESKINELSLKIEGPEGNFALSELFSKIWQTIVTKLADAANGITEMIAGTFRAKDKLCINDTCVTEAQLQALLLQAANNNSSSGGGTPAPDNGGSDSSGSDESTSPADDGGGAATSTPETIGDSGGDNASSTPEVIADSGAAEEEAAAETPTDETTAPEPAPEPTS